MRASVERLSSAHGLNSKENDIMPLVEDRTSPSGYRYVSDEPDLKPADLMDESGRETVSIGANMTVNRATGPADPMSPPSNRGHSTIGTVVEQRQRQMQGLGDLAEAAQVDDPMKPRNEGYFNAKTDHDPRTSEQMMADLARMTSEGKSGF